LLRWRNAESCSATATLLSVGERNVGVALQAGRRQLQDLGVPAVGIDQVNELPAIVE